MKIIIATANQGKLKEIKKILKNTNLDIVSSTQAGIVGQVNEDGKTLKANAVKKAKYVSTRTKQWSLADDTGLFIKALKNRPGVHTARWAGKNVNGKGLIDFTLKKLKDLPQQNRQAYFKTVVALTSPNGKIYTFEGKIKGNLTKTPRGKIAKHLPYDSIFLPIGQKKTFAQMTKFQKNKISHRSLGLKKLADFIKQIANE
ncbi:MAG: RdgB/HAM1 family non-canonical purine NTP pyrophosphatase [Patescibacteria group bacterium]|jgi:XTP/dITP diphosphohydrolase|nr:RdgB/HAM1 family non-canonical purine NTP pyrophosphatase [Patescibacteria group bacterium]